MTLKVCNKCGSARPLRKFHSNGPGKRKGTCTVCTRKTSDIDLSKMKLRAVQMWNEGKTLTEICQTFKRDRRTVSYWLKSSGICTRERSNAEGKWARKGDPDALEPIGKAGEKWADVDAAILRAYREAGLIKRGDKWLPGPKRGSPSANPWPAQSSLA